MKAPLFAHQKNFLEVNMNIMQDPIVEEVRKARMEHAEKLGNNIDEILKDIQIRQKKYGAELVRRAPKLKLRATGT